MEVLVVDGQGGGIGKSIIQALKENFKDIYIIGVGTNSMASSQLKKGGADVIATGENAVVFNAQNASIIIGPIGIAFGNSMFGEITPVMAQAIGLSKAKKYLLPMSQCSAQVVGTQNKSIPEYIDDLIIQLKNEQ